MFVPDLPKTCSGKIMRRLLRDIAEGCTLGDTTTLADGGVVDTIRDASGSAEDFRRAGRSRRVTRTGGRSQPCRSSS